MTLFVIMDPIGTIPIFLSLTRGRSPGVGAAGGLAGGRGVVRRDRRRSRSSASRSWTTSASRCPALQGAGGLLLLLVALELLTGKEQAPTAAVRRQRRAGAAGHAAAGRARARSSPRWCSPARSTTFAEFVAVALGVVLVHVALWLSMRFSLPILRLLREGGVVLVSRIAGLLLSAIAVQLVADAVRAFIAGEG